MSRADDEIWETRVDAAYNKFTRNPWLTTAKWSAIFVGVILVLSLIGNAFGIVNVYWGAQKAKLTAPAREQQAIYSDPQEIIAKNGYFHTQCRKIVADGFQLKTMEQTLTADKANKPADPVALIQWEQMLESDQSGVRGATLQIQTDAEDYDAKAASYGFKPFRDASLPRRIELQGNGLPPTIDCH